MVGQLESEAELFLRKERNSKHSSKILKPLIKVFRGDLADGRNRLLSLRLAYQVEARIHSSGGSLSARARELVFGLRKNPVLRRSVLQGSTTIETLCAMTSEDLAPQNLKVSRLERKRHLDELISFEDGDMRAQYRCARCGRVGGWTCHRCGGPRRVDVWTEVDFEGILNGNWNFPALKKDPARTDVCSTTKRTPKSLKRGRYLGIGAVQKFKSNGEPLA